MAVSQRSAIAWVLRPFQVFGEMVGLIAEAAGYIVRGAVEYRTTVDQMAQTGFNSLPLVALTLSFTGMVMAFHMAQQSTKFSADALMGWLLAEAFCRELGPVLASIVVAARVGSAITAELGTMKVTEQLDALRSLAVSPTQYLVVPRLVACLTMVPALAVAGDVAGIGGGYLYSIHSQFVSGTLFVSSISERMDWLTVVAGVAKAVFFGVIIAIVGCHQGMFCRRAAEDVGRATTRSVVYSITGIFISDFFLSKLLFPSP
ncbi:MAG: MlaE family ABC transporter permease [Candidatus Zipacnadales bacterium]